MKLENGTDDYFDSLWVGSWPVWGTHKIKVSGTSGVEVRRNEEGNPKSLQFRVAKLLGPENDNPISAFAGCMQSMLNEVPQKKRILLLYSSQGKAEQIKKMFVSGAKKNQAVLYTSEKKPVLSYGKLFSYRECSGAGPSWFYVSRPEDFSGLSAKLAGSGPGLRAIIDNVENPARLGIFGTECEVLYTYDLRTLRIQDIKELITLVDFVVIDLSNPVGLQAKEEPDPKSITYRVRVKTARPKRECTLCKQNGELNGRDLNNPLLNTHFPLSAISGMETWI